MKIKICEVCETENEEFVLDCINCGANISYINAIDKNNKKTIGEEKTIGNLLFLNIQDKEYKVEKDIVIGREGNFHNELFTEKYISRKHLELKIKEMKIKDISLNGVHLNNQKLNKNKYYILKNNDIIKIRNIELLVKIV